ncbi:NADH:flavin oxidoreductase [Halovenus sp. WSH3]|uniref:NADH:flavin oxidoreductase n=1 Tax=Halovenus carboxidivorans TaxID=2692199 RepID=A0A6B0T0R1_9EURY|nr:NADH:flavin oxidoreductase [Halovenus carboxidivorans]MXR51788.1 NADH:flavin oxidoreductase [Halovenus carboxidivorans]
MTGREKRATDPADATLTEPIEIGGVELRNRLYRAPLLECAGNGPDAVETYIDELEPAAESGAGLIFQGASIVTESGGCAAPNMTRVHDPAFVDRLSALTDRIHDHGSRIFIQLAHGGLRSMSLWHSEYRTRNPEEGQLAVSEPPVQLRAADRAGLIDLDPDVLSTAEVYDLAEAFGRAAGYAADAGYDGIHLSGANMGIIQQFLSPYYNDRDDEFADGVRFLLAVRDAVREHAGAIPLVTKVPAETAAPPFVRTRLDRDDAVTIAERLAEAGYDALVPVECSVYWDMSLIRGAYPDRAWAAEELRSEYAAVFGSRLRARAVSLLNRLQARQFPAEPGWNADLCRRVRERVDVPVLCEGGLREREHCEAVLGGPEPAADLVGLGRPFYAEPRLPARLLAGKRALCESCNNCTVPQATGEPGRCHTPRIVRRRARLEREGAYSSE